MPKSKRKRKRSSKRSTPRARSNPWGWDTTQTRSACDAVGQSGAYETLRAYRGRVFALQAHLARLQASLKTIGIPLPQPVSRLAATVRRLARRWQHTDVTIRVAVFGGAARPGRRAARPTCVVAARALRARSQRWYTDGVAITTTPAYRAALAAIPSQAKHADMLPGILAWGETRARPAELLYRVPDGCVGEGTVSNLCIITADRQLISTPPAAGVLAGVAVQVLFAVASRAGLTPQWRPLTRVDIWTAAEVLLSNSVFEVLPVVACDGRMIGVGRPGAITRQLRQLFRTVVQEDDAL